MFLGHSEQAAKQIGQPFERLGILHQIVNDMQDMTSKGGREAGQDLYEGKQSIVALVYQREAPEDAHRFAQFLRLPRDEKTSDQVNAELKRIVISGTPQKILEEGKTKAATILQESTSLDAHPALKEILQRSESPRIWWRLQLLREWSYEQVEQVFC
ncbi:hypothetical protein GWC77_28070 [Paraburkholderia sp. NMBU_R16]|uniref:polyprenyl synthetase family protein n=1 Tax=Paraburkholderia sp. NMBU_R16 TaxID=2698676 RepID=UPI0015656DD9|nr:polyprenyl synthetase family protein [Paraburkholderia sp. NMBU_R16]NRO99699.1 hypothetical protein [Paraburkholderia sp. NMBU_R16]